MIARVRSLRPLGRAALGATPVLVLVLALAAGASAAEAPKPAAKAPRAAPPPPSLGAYAPLLEGTWEFVSMKLPDGTVLQAPTARGVIVIDKGVYLAASYVKPTAVREVGSIWEGRLVIEGDKFQLLPARGYRYDSLAEERVHWDLPPRSGGTVSRTPEGLVLAKDGGGTVLFPAGTSRRVQTEPDGTVIEHLRTSLTPRIPDDLPGRDAVEDTSRGPAPAAPATKTNTRR